MKNFLKGKVATGIVLLSTFVLAGIAIFTAVRLYQLRQTSVAPNVPESQPQAADGLAGSACGFDESTGNNVDCAPGFICDHSQPSTSMGVCRATSCNLNFTITISPTATATATATPTTTPTTTPTPTTTSGGTNSCGGTCGSNSNCNSDLICSNGYCRNPSCTGETDCICAASPTTTATATAKSATSKPTATATPAALPQSGTDWPTMLGIGIGILTIVGSLLLAI